MASDCCVLCVCNICLYNAGITFNFKTSQTNKIFELKELEETALVNNNHPWA